VVPFGSCKQVLNERKTGPIQFKLVIRSQNNGNGFLKQAVGGRK
jgi:hypothetical protein